MVKRGISKRNDKRKFAVGKPAGPPANSHEEQGRNTCRAVLPERHANVSTCGGSQLIRAAAPPVSRCTAVRPRVAPRSRANPGALSVGVAHMTDCSSRTTVGCCRGRFAIVHWWCRRNCNSFLRHRCRQSHLSCLHPHRRLRCHCCSSSEISRPSCRPPHVTGAGSLATLGAPCRHHHQRRLQHRRRQARLHHRRRRRHSRRCPPTAFGLHLRPTSSARS